MAPASSKYCIASEVSPMTHQKPHRRSLSRARPLCSFHKIGGFTLWFFGVFWAFFELFFGRFLVVFIEVTIQFLLKTCQKTAPKTHPT
jgi:hypothetical protein